MKKCLIFLLLICCVASLSCCNAQKSEDIIRLPMRITAKLEGSDALFTADIKENCCDIVFDSNHALAGTVLHFGEEVNTATCGDFTREVKRGIFPAQESLIKALKAVGESENTGVSTENGVKYTIDEMTIMVYYDEDTKTLTSIRTEESGRRYDFTVVGLELYEEQSDCSG
jgi:hypothetical protein